MSPETQSNQGQRIHSIDAFRALTMLLMIWVNDFWSLIEIPNWLQHMPAEADALGFSDVIFPAFLFIVGLSIPFAINNRRDKGDGSNVILRHIIERSFALLLMGFFMVNLESLAGDKVFLGKQGWQILMALAFILIWNVYPAKQCCRYFIITLKTLGYLILVFLALVYVGPGDPGLWMKPYWWGILGLIGWGYLTSAITYLFWGQNWKLIAAVWVFFAGFNLAESTGQLEFLSSVRSYVWFTGSGSIAALTLAGAFVSTIYLQKAGTENRYAFFRFLLILGIAVLVIGFAVRPFGGLSKIRSTPAWTEICTGISILSYALLFWLVDIRGKCGWMNLIRPAGNATLTCYLVPYFYYAFVSLLGISLPIILKTGMVGLVKSMIFAFLIVWITGGLNRMNIKLKI